MKRLLSLIILLSMIICVFTVPVNAKTNSEKKSTTKTLTMHLNNEGRGIKATCSIPYYSKWKISDDVIYGDEAVLKTSKNNDISIMVMRADEDPDAKLCCKYLSKKKYKKEFLEYLEKELDDPYTDVNSVYKIIKDGHGKYMLTVDMGELYGVIRLLDEDHVMLYSIYTYGEPVSKSIKKKIISYSKQANLEKKTTGNDNLPDPEPEPDIDIEIPDIELDADRLIFSAVYSNMAWGFEKQTIYVLGDGRMFLFDFTENASDFKGELSDENILEYLKKTEPYAMVDKDYLLKMYAYAIHVDPEAKYTTEHLMCDYGQISLYFHNENGESVLCANDGDVRYNIDDKYANKVDELWNNIYIYMEKCK